MVSEVVSASLWAAWALTSFVVALAGPFGTFDSQPFVWRLTYWSGLIAAAIVIAILCRTIWRQLLADHPEWHEDLAVALSLAISFSPMVILLNRAIGGPEAYQAMGVLAAMGCVFAIAMSIIALRRAIRGTNRETSKQPGRDRLFSRISARPDTRLARISSDNHYIRVFTDDGEEHRILMRLRDAVDETDVEQGFCVHRSHWVARHAVVGIKKVNGRESVALSCGTEVPIGPKYRANLDFASFITD